MIDHIPQEQFEKLLLTPDAVVEAERKRVDAHVRECALCRDHWTKLQGFYEDLERELEAGPSERDRVLAERLLARRRLALPERLLGLPGRVEGALDKYAEILEPFRRPLAERLIRYVQLHPVRFAGAMSFALVAIVLSLVLTRTPKDTNPTSARVKDAVLSVVNKEGEVLWTKDATGMSDVVSGAAFPRRSERRSISVADIDGDGIKDALVFGSGPVRPFSDDTLSCFEHDGTPRWKTGGGDVITFGTMKFTKEIRWSMRDVFTVNDPEYPRLRTFVIAQATPYWPGKVFEIDPASGRHTQEYWHAGGLSIGLPLDIDLDGKEEIILGGINNAYESACIVVLDPSHVSGYGPTLPSYIPEAVLRGAEKYYVLLHRTDLHQALANVAYNDIDRLVPATGNSFVVHTAEGSAGEVLYTFGPGMDVKSVVGSDAFIVSHERLQKEGRLTKKLTPEYWEELKESVTYWDSQVSRFVSYDELRKKKSMP